MNDRELLEMAAKAAGIVGVWHERGQCILVTNCAGMPDIWWRPHEDDGDALRLAVDLNVDLHINERAVELFSGDLDDCITQPCIDGDKRAACRRAITRAAAAIGKDMK